MQVYLFENRDDTAVSLTVRPWFESVEDFQAKAFAADTPEQRQRLFFNGKRLQEDGRVLAQHGVVAESTIQLVSDLPDRFLSGRMPFRHSQRLPANVLVDSSSFEG